MAIHSTAIVAPGAEIDPSCEIGPFAVIGPMVKMGRDNVVGAHAVVEGNTRLGTGTASSPTPSSVRRRRTSSIGGRTPAWSWATGTWFASSPPSMPGRWGAEGSPGSPTSASSWPRPTWPTTSTWATAASSPPSARWPGTSLAEDGAIFGGVSAVQQFTRIGRLAYIGGLTGVDMDVAPYLMVAGARGEVVGINTVGLQRAGFTEEQVGRVKDAYRIVFRSKLPLKDALAQVRAEMGQHPEIAHWVKFIEGSERGIIR